MKKEKKTKVLIDEYKRKLLKLVTYDPENSSLNVQKNYTLYTRDKIIQWLQNPSTSTNSKSLRNASNYMYLASMHYRRLLAYYAGLFVGSYVIAPLNFNRDEVKDSFAKQYKKVTKAIELMNIPAVMRTLILVALREGAFYGVRISDNQSAFILQINSDYCQITSVCDGSFLYSVDMTKISSMLEYYPAEFTEMYGEYLRTGEKWQEVPIDISVCIKADESMLDVCVPPFAAVMPSLYSLANREALQEAASELRNYKMIAGEVPTDDSGRPTMAADEVEAYYDHISNNIDKNVGVVLTPFKLASFNFDNKSGTVDIDDFANATSNFWSTAGTSGLLHGQSNNTSGVTKLAIKNDESFVYPMVQQFEKVVNRYLKSAFSGSVKFKITILPVSVFNREEYLKTYKEAAAFGIGKSYYAAALGIPQCDVSALDYLEKEVMHFDQLSPLKSSYTTSSDNSGAGRPQSGDGDISDSGEKTRDNGTNDDK